MQLDHMSQGRLIVGLGAGWNEREYRAFGFPYDQRVSRFEEAFTIIRTLLRDGAVDFEATVVEPASGMRILAPTLRRSALTSGFAFAMTDHLFESP